MKTLLLLRHAKSSWKDESLRDHERPLNARGRRDAPRMGRLLDAEGLVPDLILTSTAVRAHRTAGAVAEACGFDGSIEYLDALYHGDPDTIIDTLQRVDDGHARVLIVSHNPGLELLLNDYGDDAERFPTAAMAQIEFPIDRWIELDDTTPGRIVSLWRPRELPVDGEPG